MIHLKLSTPSLRSLFPGLILLLILSRSTQSYAQLDPVTFEYRTETIDMGCNPKNPGGTSKVDHINDANIAGALNGFGTNGWELVFAETFVRDETGTGQCQFKGLRYHTYIYCIFKRAKNLKEGELSQIIKNVQSRIDTLTTAKADERAAELRLILLNTLNKMPANILSSEYAETLEKKIEAYMKETYQKQLDDIRNELQKIKSGQ